VSSKCFQLYYTCSDRLLAMRSPLALSIFFSSYCDVSQALGYFSSAIRTFRARANTWKDAESFQIDTWSM
jgi:hypothetical protein